MSKKVFRLFTIADYEEEEAWLREKAKAGLKLTKVTPLSMYVFEETAPEDVIYRLDYQNKKPTEQYKQMYRDFGWEYVGEQTGWSYFRKAAEAAETEDDGELFSDNASKLGVIEHLMKTRILPTLCIFLCVMVPSVFRYAGAGEHSPVAVVFYVILLCLIGFEAVLLLHCAGKLGKLKAKYEL